ncbi:Na+/H+ antiporter subunit G [Marinospirillum alkaliphilum]|uniref:Multicomponent K+:H+ antiporter subunit G n=1 Tax=Marinospirillum alkaliphilum DSM 21637 TaxID=1122209 RepID=A0A1K1ZHH4_9GAMM|nr:Na+/H+ antiporter subunit G [Marinospirillum alkaliphilum]SFX72965.1 multicomponent K+:H+ antiporter subunit G [Marinospirillum alkaliphilum DSM 21637]
MNWVEILLGFFVLLGGVFMLVGSIGLARLPDFYMRLHAPTKATTLGVGALLIASMMFFTIQDGAFSIHEILVTIFLFITAPVSAHMMAKSAVHVKTRIAKDTQGLAVRDAAEKRNNPLL